MFDIGRSNWTHFQRSEEEYLGYAKRLLHLNVPLILYVEKKYVNFISHYRKGKERITRIIEMKLTDLEFYSMYQQIQAVQKSMQEGRWKDNFFRNHPEISSPEYVLLMASKVHVMSEAMKFNPFCSDYFYWIDFGCSRDDQMMPKTNCWAPHNIMTNPKTHDKVVFMIFDPMPSPSLYHMRTLDDLIQNMQTVYIKGSFFGGPMNAMFKYYELFRKTFVKLLGRNFTDDDQTIVAACYLEQTEHIMYFYPSDAYDFFNMFKIFY